MRHFRRSVSVASLALLGLPAGVHAAVPWSAPASVTGSAGAPEAIWSSAAGHSALLAPAAGGTGDVIVALSPAGALLHATPVGLLVPLAATYGKDRVAVLGATADTLGTTGGPGGSTVVVLGSASGDLGRPRTLATAPGSIPRSLAANARGDIAALVSAGHVRTLFVRRAGGAAFATVLRMKLSSQGRDSALAVGPSGDVLLTWEDRHHIYARRIGTTGHIGATRRVGDGVQSTLRPLVSASGRLSVAWKSQRVNEGDAGPATFRFVTAAPGRRFGAQRTFSAIAVGGPGRDTSASSLRLLADGADEALLAFAGFEGGHYVVRASEVRHGHLAAPETLSAPLDDSALVDAAASTGGAAVVTWRTGIAGIEPLRPSRPTWPPVELQGAVRPSHAATFGAPEPISAAHSDDVTGGFVTIVPGSATVITTWGTFTPGGAGLVSARALT